REALHGLEEAHLRGEVLAAVGNVDRSDGQVSHRRGDDSVLVVELGMLESRPLREGRLANVEADAGVALLAVPVAPVAFHLAEHRGDLVGGRLDLLEAYDVGVVPLDPRSDLGFAGANPVDVPGSDLHSCERRRSRSALAVSSAARRSAPRTLG